ncbi:MAG: hypothetical protein EBQ96_00550 [Proteobacteria bacterium]|nr:hypothetical protein [Pseudomonadota bacterium]
MKQEFAISQSKAAARGTLRESLGAVSAALSAVPDNVIRMPSTAAGAFLLIDPVLSTIHRQLLDARAHYASLVALLGPSDPMIEALDVQVAALEEAYALRMAALKKRREEGRKNKTRTKRDTVSKVVVQNLSEVRGQKGEPKRRNDTLWLWVLIAVMLANQAAMRKSGPRLDAA